MKTGICIVAVTLMAGAAIAQQSSSQPPQAPAGQEAQGQHPARSSSKPSTMNEMKTQTFKGVLVDMSCAGGATGTASRSKEEGAAETAAPANGAERSAASQSGSCAVSANSTQFGLKTKDGRTLRFDMVGNQRAQDNLKNNKKWNKEMSGSKEINATVSGAVSGDKLIVSSIH